MLLGATLRLKASVFTATAPMVTARMATTNHDHVEGFGGGSGESHERNVWRLPPARGAGELPAAEQLKLQPISARAWWRRWS